LSILTKNVCRGQLLPNSAFALPWFRHLDSIAKTSGDEKSLLTPTNHHIPSYNLSNWHPGGRRALPIPVWDAKSGFHQTYYQWKQAGNSRLVKMNGEVGC
jgi:hypothetical protein